MKTKQQCCSSLLHVDVIIIPNHCVSLCEIKRKLREELNNHGNQLQIPKIRQVRRCAAQSASRCICSCNNISVLISDNCRQ